MMCSPTPAHSLMPASAPQIERIRPEGAGSDSDASTSASEDEGEGGEGAALGGFSGAQAGRGMSSK